MDTRPHPKSVREMVDWLWQHIGSSDKQFRRGCMQSFTALCPLLRCEGMREEEMEADSGFASTFDDPHTKHRSIGLYIQSYITTHGVAGLVRMIEGNASTFRGTMSSSDIISDQAWLSRLSALLDCYCWLVQLRYVDPATLFLARSSSSSASNPSSAKPRKRKALALEVSDDEDDGASTTGCSPTVFSTLRQFLVACTDPLALRSLRKQPGFDEGAGDAIKSNLKSLRAEVFLRSLNLIVGMLTVAADQDADNGGSMAEASAPGSKVREQLSQMLRTTGVWGPEFHDVFLGALLSPGSATHSLFPASAQSPAMEIHIPDAAQQLLRHLHVLESAGCDIRIESVFEEKFTDSLDKLLDANTDSETMNKFIRAYHVFKESSLILVALGYDHKLKIKSVAYQILVKVAQLPPSAPPSSIDMGRKVVQLVLTMGIPLMGSAEPLRRQVSLDLGSLDPFSFNSTPSNDEPCVLEVLRLPVGGLFLQRYEDILVDAVVGERGAAFIENGSALIVSALAERDQEEGNNAVLERLLTKSLAKIVSSGTQSVPVQTIVSILDIFQTHLHLVPIEMSFQLLELDALIPPADKHLRCTSLHSRAIADVVHTLQEHAKFTCDEIIQRIQLLPFVLSGTSKGCPRPVSAGFEDQQDTISNVRGNISASQYHFHVSQFPCVQIVEALEEVVAQKFPLDSKALDPQSVEGKRTAFHVYFVTELHAHDCRSTGKEFHRLLKCYLDSLVECGAPCLLGPLLPTLREGTAHKYTKLISSALQGLVEAVDVDGEDNLLSTSSQDEGAARVVNAICGVCIAHILDEGQSFEVKRILFDQLCLPTLRRCSPVSLCRLLSSRSGTGGGGSGLSLGGASSDLCVIKQIYEKLSQELTGSDPEVLNSLVLVQSCLYALVEMAYDRCVLSLVKGEITQAFVGSPSATGKELTAGMCRLVSTKFKGALPSSIHKHVAHRFHSSAFNCLVIIVAKSQTEEKFFDNFIFGSDKKISDHVWDRVIDCECDYTFTNDGGKFLTVLLGPALDIPSGAKSRILGSLRKRKLAQHALGSAATSGLMSQYLSGSVLASSSLSKRGQGMTQNLSQSGGFYSQSQRQGLSQLGSQYGEGEYVRRGLGSQSQPDGWEGPSRSLPRSSQSRGADNDEFVPGFDDQVIALELNDVNTQRCMGPLVRAIQKMEVAFGERWEDAFQRSGTLPKWINICKTALVDFSGPKNRRNVRLFFLRLLLNQPVASIAATFMSELLPAILECCLHDLCADGGENSGSSSMVSTSSTATGDGGRGRYDYFMRDVVFTLCDTWKDACPDSFSSSLACRFLSYLIKVVYDSEPNILRGRFIRISIVAFEIQYTFPPRQYSERWDFDPFVGSWRRARGRIAR